MVDITESSTGAAPAPLPLPEQPDTTPLTAEEQEAADAALQELARLDEAQSFRAEPLAAAQPASSESTETVSRYMAPIPVDRGYVRPDPLPGRAQQARGDYWGQPGAPPMARPPVAEHVASVPMPPKETKTLEDLYAAFPQIGDGQTYIRVERLQPKTWGGASVAGYIGQLHDKISMDDFALQYGGTKYVVEVMGPGPRPGPDGVIPIRRLSSRVEITVPGAPAMGTSPQQERQEEYSMAMQGGRLPGMPVGRGGLMYPYGGEPAEVSVKRLEIEAARAAEDAAEKRRILEQMQAAVRPPEQMYEAVTRAAERTVTEVKDITTQQISLLRDQNTQLLRDVKDRDAELSDHRNKLVEAERRIAESQRYTETEQTRQLKERYETDLRRMQEDHRQAIDRMTNEHRQQVSEITTRGNEERQRLVESEQRERERLREDSVRREQQVKDDADRRERAQRETYESRIADLDRQLTRETQNLRDTHARELEAIRSTESTKATVAEKTAGFKVENMADRLHRLEVDNQRLLRENDELRAKINKTPLEAIQEAHALADITGYGKDGGAGDEKKDPSWSEIGQSVMKALVDKVPDGLKVIGDMRAQNQQQAQQVQQQQAQQQAQHDRARQMQAQQLAAGQRPVQQQQRRQQRRPAWAAPPPMGSDHHVPPAWSGPIVQQESVIAVTGISAPGQGPQPPPAQGGEPAAVPMGSPVQPDGPAPIASSAQQGQESPGIVQHVAAPMQAAPPPAPAMHQAPMQQAAPPDAAAAGGGVALTQQMASAFVQQLEARITEGVVPPSYFARGFIDEAGSEVAAEVLRRMTPDELFASIQASVPESADLRMLTRDGKKYVREVFAEARALLGMPPPQRKAS